VVLSPITDWSAKESCKKLLDKKLAEAAILVGPAAKLAAGTVTATIAVGRYRSQDIGKIWQSESWHQQGLTTSLVARGKVRYGHSEQTAPTGWQVGTSGR
jgi:hypothetical protein